jgi:hypothetical protein
MPDFHRTRRYLPTNNKKENPMTITLPIVETLRNLSDQKLARLDETHANLYGRWFERDQKAKEITQALADTETAIDKNLKMAAEVQAYIKEHWPPITPHDLIKSEIARSNADRAARMSRN